MTNSVAMGPAARAIPSVNCVYLWQGVQRLHQAGGRIVAAKKRGGKAIVLSRSRSNLYEGVRDVLRVEALAI